ncbi:EamA family transporter [Myxococcaceae bacterium JPH2]|nr:EamA family transporter [Myxococcaceae bacterium JPH2]
MLKRHPNPEVGVVSVIAVSLVGGGVWALGLHGPAFASSRGVAWTLAAGVFETVYLASLARALRHAPLGIAYTVSRGGAMLWVWPVSVLWLGETVSVWTVSGAVTIGLGLLLMQLARPTGPVATGVAWAAVAAVCIASYHLSYKLALGAGTQPPALFSLSMCVALPMLVGERVHRLGWRVFRQEALASPARVVAAGIVCTLSFAFMLIALSRTGAGAVMTLRNTSIAFALGLAALQGERLGRRQLAGAGLVAVGTVLLGWPG